MALRLLGVWALVLALVLGGCTYSREEPGLFRVRSPSPSSPASPPLPEPDTENAGPVNPQLPVAGETVWTSGEGVGVTVRFAVHAVRRIVGGTVLDYSITPLSAPGLATGDELPPQVDLGLTRYEGNDVAVWLLDPSGSRVYRSLAHVSPHEFHHCLCTPLWVSQPAFRVGQTQLLQLTFPTLPRRLHQVDVLIANQEPVVGVPVTPVGQVPTPGTGIVIDLLRPPGPPQTGALRSVGVPALGPTARVQVGLDEVLAAPGVTALRWTLRAPAGLSYRLFAVGAPVSRPVPAGVAVPALNSADGPTLGVPRHRGSLTASWLTNRFRGVAGYECLCSELDLWARSLTQPGGVVHLTTLYPGLPAGTRTVEVGVPGLPAVPVRVQTLRPAAERVGRPVPGTDGTWVYSSDAPPLSRGVGEWPTPLPDPWQLPDYRGRTERVLPLPRP